MCERKSGLIVPVMTPVDAFLTTNRKLLFVCNHQQQQRGKDTLAPWFACPLNHLWKFDIWCSDRAHRQRQSNPQEQPKPKGSQTQGQTVLLHFHQHLLRNTRLTLFQAYQTAFDGRLGDHASLHSFPTRLGECLISAQEALLNTPTTSLGVVVQALVVTHMHQVL